MRCMVSGATTRVTLHPPQTCHTLATRHGLLGLDCPVVSGNSGAPLLQRTEWGWQVVATMVASSSTGLSALGRS